MRFTSHFEAISTCTLSFAPRSKALNEPDLHSTSAHTSRTKRCNELKNKTKASQTLLRFTTGIVNISVNVDTTILYTCRLIYQAQIFFTISSLLISSSRLIFCERLNGARLNSRLGWVASARALATHTTTTMATADSTNPVSVPHSVPLSHTVVNSTQDTTSDKTNRK